MLTAPECFHANLFFLPSGETLTITASGTFHETIEEGAVVNVEVKWGVIILVKQTMDLCDQIENVDLKCPLEKGKMVLTKQVDLPQQIPPVSFLRSRHQGSAHVSSRRC